MASSKQKKRTRRKQKRSKSSKSLQAADKRDFSNEINKNINKNTSIDKISVILKLLEILTALAPILLTLYIIHVLTGYFNRLFSWVPWLDLNFGDDDGNSDGSNKGGSSSKKKQQDSYLNTAKNITIEVLKGIAVIWVLAFLFYLFLPKTSAAIKNWIIGTVKFSQWFSSFFKKEKDNKPDIEKQINEISKKNLDEQKKDFDKLIKGVKEDLTSQQLELVKKEKELLNFDKKERNITVNISKTKSGDPEQVEKLKKELIQVQTNSKEAQKQFHELIKTIQEKNGILYNLSQKLYELSANKALTQEELLKTKEKYNKLQKEYNKNKLKVEKSTEMTEKRIKLMEARNEKLISKVQKQEEEKMKIEETLKKTNSKMKENEEQLEKKKAELETIKGANYRSKSKKQTDIKKLEKEIKKSKTEIEKSKEKEKNITKQLAQSTEETERLQNLVQTGNERFEELKDENAQYQSFLQEYKASMETKIRELDEVHLNRMQTLKEEAERRHKIIMENMEKKLRNKDIEKKQFMEEAKNATKQLNLFRIWAIDVFKPELGVTGLPPFVDESNTEKRGREPMEVDPEEPVRNKPKK